MLDINVKTIDGQNRSYSVPDNYTVKQFKEKIAHSLSIPIERQRLIFQGKELKDVNLLSDFDVNGKTLHLVQRLPPTRSDERTSTSSTSPNTSFSTGGVFNLGSIPIDENQRNTSETNPNTNANNIPDFVQQLLGGLGELGQNATFNTTNIGDSNNMEVHIDLGNVSQLVNENEIKARVRNIRRFLQMAQSRLNRLEEIQSGAPLEDVPGSTIIVGSIQTTATLTDGSSSLDNSRLFTTSIPFSTILQPPIVSSTSTTSDNSNTNTNTNNNSNPSPTQPQQPENIGVDVLADLIKQITEVQNKFQPYLQQYHEMLLNDMNEPTESPQSASPQPAPSSASSYLRNSNLFPNSNSQSNNVIVLGDNRRQRFANNINDMMHLLGHLYHNLSDLHINLRDQPPRQMHTMNTMQHSASAIIGAAIPVEASIQIPISMSTTTTTTTTTSSNNNNTESTTGVADNNQNQNQSPFSFDFLRARQRSSNSTGTAPNNQASNQQQTPIIISSSTMTNRPRPTFPRASPMGIGSHIRPPFSPFPSTNQSTLNSYDQFLPCNSVHFYNSMGPIIQNRSSTASANLSAASQRRRHPAGDQQTNRTTNPSTDTSNSNNNPNDLPRFIRNIISSALVGGSNPTDSNVRVNIGGVPGHVQIQRIATQSNDNRPGNSTNPIEFLTSQIFGGGFPLPNTNTTTPTNNNNNNNNNVSQVAQQNFTQALIREAMNLMDSSSLTEENEQRLNQPLGDFIRMFGDLDEDDLIDQRSSLNILTIFFQSLSLGDMINLARGQQREQVFERSRQPLRDHLQTKYSITSSSVENDENITRFIDCFYTDMFIDSSALNLNLNQFDLINPKIDFALSFEKLIKHHLKKLVLHILNDSYNSETTQTSGSQTWTSVLFDLLQSLMDQVISLFRACVKNGDHQFIQIITQKIYEAVTSRNMLVNAPIASIFENYIRSKLQQMIQSINLPRSDIDAFILYKQDFTQATSSIIDDKTNKNESKQEASLQVEDEDQYDSASSTLSGNSMDIDQHFAENKKIETQQAATTSSLTNDWTSSVPSDWVSTIERDIEQQKNFEQHNTSFSDAYMNGLPSKRRRILSSKNDLLTQNLFKKVLNKTLDQVKLKPHAKKQDFVDDTIKKSELIDQFDDQFDNVISDRLKQDQDYLNIINSSEHQGDNDMDSSSNDHIYNKNRFKFSKKRFK